MTFRLAHTSDFHLTGTEADREALEGLFVSLRKHEVDHLLVTGDVSHGGEAEAFALLDDMRRQHGYGPARSTILPGNHDLPGRRAFTRRFGADGQVLRRLGGNSLRLVGLDSTGWNAWAGSVFANVAGWLEDFQLEQLRRTLAQLRRGRGATVLALHHHVVRLPPPDHFTRVGEPLGLWGPLANADELLDIAAEFEVELVLTGHDHSGAQRTVRRRDARVRCVVGGSTFDVQSQEVWGYRFFDFHESRLVNENWVSLCNRCWSLGAVECDECDEDAEVPCDSCAQTGFVSCPTCEGGGRLECGACEGDGAFECGHCQGAGCGHCAETGARECSACNGEGERDCDECDEDAEVECEECAATGFVLCAECGGEGQVDCDECD